ncbi:MAG: adenine phosphoribosyltransferase [Candidatus Aenigmarchaeota archaeon]|nr:adenine phosphoribosyltransferase [Candidatus Aenigmarchaeota archaeon]
MIIDHKLREIKDFPKKGVVFKDITKLLEDGKTFKYVVEKLVEFTKMQKADVVAGIESRGYIFSSPVAYSLGLGHVMIRKQGKLPFKTIREVYNYEYSSNSLEIHVDSITPGQKVVIIDDILATGGTGKAAAKLIERLGGKVVGMGFLLELKGLGGRETLKGYEIYSLTKSKVKK